MNPFKIIGTLVSWFSMVILGMAGGQGKLGGKSTRRFMLPGVAWITAIGFKGFRLKDLSLLLLIPVLCLGYGVDSQLGALLGHTEWLIRIVYAVLLSLPFLFYGKLKWVISAVLLLIAFQVHAGSLGVIPWFGDLLIEDAVRYGTLATVVLLNLLVGD